MKNHARKHVGSSRIVGYRTPSRFIAHQQYKKVSKQGSLRVTLDKLSGLK